MLKSCHVIARDIPDAWFQCIERVLDTGRVWTVENGSYVGQRRWETDFITVQIKYPGTRPLIPEMPPHISAPPPTDMDYVNSYLPYLMTNQPLKENEQYTYGERICHQMEQIIHRYKEKGFGSNQECISVSRDTDIYLDDPPCLRSIDCRVFPIEAMTDEEIYMEEKQSLNFYTYWRSWDLFNGFPANLAAIRLMQEYMASELGIEAGEIIAVSKGLHLYDHVWDIAKLRTDWKEK